MRGPCTNVSAGCYPKGCTICLHASAGRKKDIVCIIINYMEENVVYTCSRQCSAVPDDAVSQGNGTMWADIVVSCVRWKFFFCDIKGKRDKKYYCGLVMFNTYRGLDSVPVKHTVSVLRADMAEINLRIHLYISRNDCGT